jgi:hypothetical protein
MKAFIIVIIVSAIIGGFVGGELTDRTFLLTGAVIGALGVGGALFGLGWFFTKQDAKKRSAAFDSFLTSKKRSQAPAPAPAPQVQKPTHQDPLFRASSFVRNAGNRFDSYCSKNGFGQLFANPGPFFAWSILWLALRKAGCNDQRLKAITVDGLNKVLAVNNNLTMGVVNNSLKDKAGGSGPGLAEINKLLGIDMDRMFNDSNKVFVDRLSVAIEASLERELSGKENMFVPILDVLMSRRGPSGSKFDHMSDSEFELIFSDQCKDVYTTGTNMAAAILRDS